MWIRTVRCRSFEVTAPHVAHREFMQCDDSVGLCSCQMMRGLVQRLLAPNHVSTLTISAVAIVANISVSRCRGFYCTCVRCVRPRQRVMIATRPDARLHLLCIYTYYRILPLRTYGIEVSLLSCSSLMCSRHRWV